MGSVRVIVKIRRRNRSTANFWTIGMLDLNLNKHCNSHQIFRFTTQLIQKQLILKFDSMYSFSRIRPIQRAKFL